VICVKGTFDTSIISVFADITSGLGITGTGAVNAAHISGEVIEAIEAPVGVIILRESKFASPRRLSKRDEDDKTDSLVLGSVVL